MTNRSTIGVWCVASLLGLGWPASVPAQDARYQDEVRRIASMEAVRRAMQAIDDLEPRSASDLILLTEIPAPPFNEERRARQFAELLGAAGVDSVWIDEVGNVLALRRGRTGARTVVIEGHLDTVFPEGTDVTVRAKGDTLYAPGIGDDTRGLVVVLTVARAMSIADVHTDADVLFVGTVGEEGQGDLRGVKHFFREGAPRIDAWIAVDGGGRSRIVHRGLGSVRYRVTFRGPGGHSWGAFGLGNPHHALGRAIYLFQSMADGYTREGIRTSYNVGVIGGGTSVNSIPFASWMEVDMRSESPERLVGIDSLFHLSMRQALAEANALRRDGDSLTLQLDLIGRRPSGSLAVETPLVQRAMAVVRHMGNEPNLGIASTNSNIPIAVGVPAVTIGRGGTGGGGHSLGEWWLNDRGALAIQQALLLLLAESGIARQPSP